MNRTDVHVPYKMGPQTFLYKMGPHTYFCTSHSHSKQNQRPEILTLLTENWQQDAAPSVLHERGRNCGKTSIYEISNDVRRETFLDPYYREN